LHLEREFTSFFQQAQVLLLQKGSKTMRCRNGFITGICLAAVFCGAQTTNNQSVPSLESISPNKMQETAIPKTEWYRGAFISMAVQLKDAELSYTYQIKDPDNILIAERSKVAGQQTEGQLMLIGGHWMLAKDIPLKKDYEIDVLDVALLELKLALHLLSDAAPSGPSEIKSLSHFEVKDQKRFVVATPSATIAIESPWNLNATVEPVAPAGYSFDLDLKGKRPLHFIGTWQKDAPADVFSDDASLIGWQVYSIGLIKVREGNGTRYDIVATPHDLHPKTLGELRRLPTN
jgi:hypothetical protein